MTSSLTRYSSGGGIASARDRALAKKTREVYDEVRLQGYKIEGAVALAGHAMENVLSLHEHRAELTKGDPGLDAVLLDIELEAVRQVRKIQNGLYNKFDL